MRITRTLVHTLAVALLAFVQVLPAAAANPVSHPSAPTAGAPGTPVCGLDNGKPATGAPIPIGAVVSKTGPDDLSGPARTAEAYFNCVNANGGIHGRPIAYSIMDDGAHPEQSAQVATKLVRDVKVVAMVGNSSFVDCGANAALYDAENVLVLAGAGLPRECFHSRNIAPLNGGPRVSTIVIAEYMHRTFGDKRFAFITMDIPGLSEWMSGGITAWGKAQGVQVKSIVFDMATLDPTSIILQAVSFHPDDILVAGSREVAAPFFAAAEQQNLGAKFHWSGLGVLYDANVPKTIGPYWSGKLFVGAELQPIDADLPGVRNWRAVLDRYGSPSIRRDTLSQAGYLAARVATETLLKLDPAKIDRATVAKALRNVKGFRSDILCDPWYFGPGNEHNAAHAGIAMVVTKDGFAKKSACIEDEDPDLANIRKMETKLHLTK